jgi:hypothetical protein
VVAQPEEDTKKKKKKDRPQWGRGNKNHGQQTDDHNDHCIPTATATQERR